MNLKRVKDFFFHYKLDFLYLGLLSLLSPLYFYKLDQSSLVSWDEAWYGAIARNILESGNLFLLSYNGSIYSDHPPAGFWIMAFFEYLFGAHEFGVRIGSAVFGILGIFITYFLGRELFSKTVGFCTGLALSSTYWYLFRARSGNLDIFLTVFFLLTFYFAVKSSKNSKFLIPFSVSLSMLILTKSLIPLTIIPALIIILIGTKIDLLKVFLSLLTFVGLTTPWFIAQYSLDPSIFYRYFIIGAPGVGLKTNYYANFLQIKEYLHFGVGKWFWPGVLGVLAGPVALNKNLILLSVFSFSFFVPFVLSDKGQLWHLIPLYPFMILSFFGFAQTAGYLIVSKFFKKFRKELSILLIFGMLGFSGYFSWIQIKRSWYEFINIPRYISDEAILSEKAGKFPYKFYIDGSDFTPTAHFYSKKRVNKLSDEALLSLFETGEPFVLITHKWRLDKYNIKENKYRLIKSDRDKILIVRD